MGKVPVRPQSESQKPERPNQKERGTSFPLPHEEFRAGAGDENNAQSVVKEDDRVSEEHG